MLYEETYARRVKLYSMELMKGLKKGGFFWTRKRATRSDSDIRGYSFTDCNLNNKNLNGINLSFADLRRCSLVNTKLKNAYLRRTGFDRCVLFNTDFSYSNLYNARFIFLWYSVRTRDYERLCYFLFRALC
jgi:uncharacterized protein YjbI with pentapeptide repeats